VKSLRRSECGKSVAEDAKWRTDEYERWIVVVRPDPKEPVVEVGRWHAPMRRDSAPLVEVAE
jgi:hypothetical protein